MEHKKERWYQRSISYLRTLLGWLVPGLGVKRYIVLILAGTTLIGVGLAVLILDIYRNAPETWWLPILSAASLRELARPLRALIFGSLGGLLIVSGLWGLNRALLAPYQKPGRRMLDVLTQHRRRERGPRIVAIGGGHGLHSLLRGLKKHTRNLTAVVTVADDGGSSGKLRRSMGILPPGDIRNCLAAMSDEEALLSQLFQYRFPDDENGLRGHSFGNLLITALTEITGSFEEAVAESGKVLAVQGRVLPATLHDVSLVADIRLPYTLSEVRVAGESHIPEVPGKINRVWLEPNDPPAYPGVIQSILAADLIVIGPGSLYTSILPNLLVPDILSALRVSRAFKIFVCNLATQPGETDQYTAKDHIRALDEHVGSGYYDLVLINNRIEGTLPANVEWVLAEDTSEIESEVFQADLIDEKLPARHDPEKLAKVLIELLQERTGPLVES
jgi:uncharacterized cofD-like protein